MKSPRYLPLQGQNGSYYFILGVLAVISLIGLGAAYTMEHNGHQISGMDNQIVWGLPHVFAVFLIVAASGALNVASIGTVFGRKIYKSLGRLSVVLAVALLIGGLMILVLDLGRPDRLIVAMTYINPKSVFAWNQVLYPVFIVLGILYLWTMMDITVRKYQRPVGFAAFIWRLVLTTGTGSIFGFLVARLGYDAAIMAPLFIVMSFSFGVASFILVMLGIFKWNGREVGDAIMRKLKNLLGLFVGVVLYFVLVYHLTNLYATEHHGIEGFILAGPSIHTPLFWIGQIIIGSIIPLILVYSPLGRSKAWIAIAASLVLIGGLIQMYVIIIGGQAYPLEIVPGYEIVASGFFDHVAYHTYSPSIWEWLLGIGGIGVALLITWVACRALGLLPESLADSEVDPHAAAATASA